MLRRLVLMLGTLAALAGVAVVALVVITRLRDDDPNLLTAAPAIPTIELGGASSTAGPTAAGGDGDATGMLHFVIDQAGSEAKYVVKETLRGIADTNAVGTTNQISGNLYLTQQGLAPGQQTSFRVDLNGLRTDESLRDSYVRQNVLHTSRGDDYRYATFVAESVTGWPAAYVDNTEVALTLRGNLTIHGTTRAVEWQVKARRVGGTLTAIADLKFNMTDFGIEPPSVQIAQAQNGVALQITILARQA